MPRIAYRYIKFRPEKLAIIEQANAIIREWHALGYDLTLRQLYYQFIAHDYFPDSWIDPVYNRRNGLSPDTKNTMKNYKKLGGILNEARYGGLLDWTHITDRTRNLRNLPHWDSPSDILGAVADQFRLDKWLLQPYYVEVWVEKDALIGIVEQACQPLDVPHFSCRGYTSSSELWGAGQRLRKAADTNDRKPVVIHLGDHDPSGKDMTRDIDDRLALFSGRDISVRRIALNMDQVELYSLPPDPAKVTDPRAGAYIDEFGEESWELDAMAPSNLADLITAEVLSLRDENQWADDMNEEDEAKETLLAISDNYEDVKEWLLGDTS